MTDRTTKVLEDVRALLSDRGAWVQGDFAVSKDGTPTPLSCSSACAWCLIGALHKVTQPFNCEDDSNAYHAIHLAIREETGSGISDIVDFNDHPSTTHADVLRVLDRAIEISQQM